MTNAQLNKRALNPIITTELDASGSVVVYIPQPVVEHFKQLVVKGGNYWLNAPIEIKEFVSQFGHGLPADEHYRNQAVYKSAEQLNAKQQGATERA